MPRYFIDIEHNDVRYRDPTGTDGLDYAQACLEAAETLVDLLKNRLSGVLKREARASIRDEAGLIVYNARLVFTAAEGPMPT